LPTFPTRRSSDLGSGRLGAAADAGEHLRARDRPTDWDGPGTTGAQVVAVADHAGQPIGLGSGQSRDDRLGVHRAPPPENTRRVPNGLVFNTGPAYDRGVVLCSV